MRLQICGARGSLPSPGPQTVRYGGNTSCVHITTSDGTQLILDAGTGIRKLPADLAATGANIHILLSHLHLDHIQGLLFFSPLFCADAQITIWGPGAPGTSLKNQIARYLSNPLTPIEVRELPAHIDFRNCPVSEWQIGSACIRAEAVAHRGPTLGFRIEDAGVSVCYLPDHEPCLAGPIDALDSEWISGYALAHGVDLLLHDCQYTDSEYPEHFGWGHSALSHAVAFARRCEAKHTLLFHHDPEHSDNELDATLRDARARWERLGGENGSIEMAIEDVEVEVRVAAAPV